VGLAGLEPAASSLSEMDGRASCYAAFALVVRLRKWHRDGVNPSVQIRPSVVAAFEGNAELSWRGLSEGDKRGSLLPMT
jgi:hypothetical protein